MTLLKVLDFTDEILSGPVHIDECDLLDEWHQVLLFHLSSSFKGLQAVRLVSANGLYEPANVLTRYLFELGINLRYLDMDPRPGYRSTWSVAMFLRPLRTLRSLAKN